MDDACNIVEKKYFCELNVFRNSSKEECITRLIKNEDATCKFEQTDKTEFIELVEPNHLLISSESLLEFTSTCGVNKKFIPGKILVKYKNCTIAINGIPQPDENLQYWTRKGYLQLNGVLYSYSPMTDNEEAQLVVPNHEQNNILKAYHDDPTAGHYGIQGTLQRITPRYYLVSTKSEGVSASFRNHGRNMDPLEHTRDQTTVETVDFTRRTCSEKGKDCPIGRKDYGLRFLGFSRCNSY